MSLCILTSSYPRFRGEAINAGVFVRDFAGACCNELAECCVYTHRKGTPGTYAEGFDVIEYPWLGRETSLTSIDVSSLRGFISSASLIVLGTLGYLRLCRNKRISYSLAMWAIPSGIYAYVANMLLGTPYAIWALGSDIWRYERHRLLRFLVRRILAKADHLYADGYELAERVSAICGRPCEFLPSVRSLENVHPLPLDDPRAHPRFLYVGRYEMNKGPDVMLRAAARYISAGGGHGSFELYGEGSLLQELKRIVERENLADRVRINGVIEKQELVNRLHWCDLMVIPSRIESLPLILSDALQTGTTMIVTDVGDMARVVIKAGAGWVVPAEDEEGMAAAFKLAEEVLSRVDMPRRPKLQHSPASIARKFLQEIGMVPRFVPASDKDEVVE